MDEHLRSDLSSLKSSPCLSKIAKFSTILFAPSMATKPQTTEARPELARDLRLSHATAVVVGTVIGSGIFLVPAEMMQAVGSAKLVYLRGSLAVCFRFLAHSPMPSW